MKKILKKGIIVLTVYLIAVATTFIINNRMEQLDRVDKLSNENTSLSLNMGK